MVTKKKTQELPLVTTIFTQVAIYNNSYYIPGPGNSSEMIYTHVYSSHMHTGAMCWVPIRHSQLNDGANEDALVNDNPNKLRHKHPLGTLIRKYTLDRQTDRQTNRQTDKQTDRHLHLQWWLDYVLGQQNTTLLALLSQSVLSCFRLFSRNIVSSIQRHTNRQWI